MWLFGFLVMSSLLLAAVSLFSLPVIVVVMLMRRRLSRMISAIILASSFAAVGAYLIWTVEWFDVYRHGMPSARYLLRAMIVPTALVATAGWILGRAIGRGPLRRVPS